MRSTDKHGNTKHALKGGDRTGIGNKGSSYKDTGQEQDPEQIGIRFRIKYQAEFG